MAQDKMKSREEALEDALKSIEKNKTINATFIGPPPTPKNDAIKPSVKPTTAIHIGFVILKLFAFLIFI